jgi:hypothetical protein
MPIDRRLGGIQRALGRRGHRRAVDADLSSVQRLQAGDAAQHGGLATAGWPEQRIELPLLHAERNVVDRKVLLLRRKPDSESPVEWTF